MLKFIVMIFCQSLKKKHAGFKKTGSKIIKSIGFGDTLQFKPMSFSRLVPDYKYVEIHILWLRGVFKPVRSYKGRSPNQAFQRTMHILVLLCIPLHSIIAQKNQSAHCR